MEILSKIGFDLPVFLFNVINFMLVAYVLKRFFFKKIVDTLQQRKQLIEAGLRDAEAAQDALANAEQARQETLLQAKTAGEKIILEAQELATLQSQKMLTAAEADANAKSAAILKKAAEQKQQMLGEVQNAAAQLVAKATRKVAAIEKDTTQVEKIIQTLDMK